MDFHTLRATYITLLVKGGASVKATQEPARHSDPSLTMNVYSRLGIHDLAGALDRLPSVTGTEPQRERMRATGTDNAAAERPQYHQQLGRDSAQSGAARRKDNDPAGQADAPANCLNGATLSDDMRNNTTESEKATGRTRTANLRFTKPQGDSITNATSNSCDGQGTTPASNPDNSTEDHLDDTDLQQIVEAWPDLPDAMRAGIVAMVEAAGAEVSGLDAGVPDESATAPPNGDDPSVADDSELAVLIVKADQEDLRKMKAFLRELGTALRRAKLPSEEIARILGSEKARRLQRLAQLPAKRKRCRDRRAYREAQAKKTVERREQAKKTS